MFRINLMTAISVSVSLTLTVSANALNTRTWISGRGVDSADCGPIATPCRTLQFAHDQTAAGGEIDVLDAAGYGSMSIAKGISVVNEGGVAGVLSSSGNAITVNAGSGNVLLRGLTIQGSHAGANGIVFNSGSSLTVDNCLVQGFVGTNGAGNGISIVHSADKPVITILDTKVLDNQSAGIQYSPSAIGGGSLVVNRVVSSRNITGIAISTAGTNLAGVNVVISNTETFSNLSAGLQITGGTSNLLSAAISNFTSSNNGSRGLFLEKQTSLTISRIFTNDNFGFGLEIRDNAVLLGDGSSFLGSTQGLSNSNYFRQTTN